MAVTEKRCRACSQVRPAADFYANPKTSTGLQSKCKDCQKSYQIQWALRHQPRSRWLAARARAKQSGAIFTLSLDWLEAHMADPRCYICGTLVDSSGGRGRRSGFRKESLSLDRVIPDLGYTDTNVRLACGNCNRIKDNGTAAQHRAIADAVDAHVAANPVLRNDTKGLD